jgi:putative transposase
MYKWRKMTAQEQALALQSRKQSRRPWHCPPHGDSETKKRYIISAACYEHKPILGQKEERMLEIEQQLITLCHKLESQLFAWCILPNHYHILVETETVSILLKELGKMHGRTSRKWNLQDKTVGRKVWFNCAERAIKSDRHYWASVNYIHHNPVKHGYAEKWTDWKYSSADQYLNDIGKEKALEIWKNYPILDYGKKWDSWDFS